MQTTGKGVKTTHAKSKKGVAHIRRSKSKQFTVHGARKLRTAKASKPGIASNLIGPL